MRDFGISSRGGAFTFSKGVTEKFLRKNNLDLLVRSHEVEDDGVGFQHGDKCITVFSAPNYLGTVGNKGGALRFRYGQPMDKPEVIRFSAFSHPSQ
jgi:serine/threonine-protein phosphatase 5